MTSESHLAALLRLLSASDVYLHVNRLNPRMHLVLDRAHLMPQKVYDIPDGAAGEAYDDDPVEHMRCLAFTTACDFRDVYIASMIGSLAGVTHAFHMGDSRREIQLGYSSAYFGIDLLVAKPLSIEKLLELSPSLATEEAVRLHFPQYSQEELGQLDDYYAGLNDAGEWQQQQAENDRATFDFLTGGSRGGYDDWRESGEDFRDLRDSMGL